ncbi:MAG TPA: carbohydrate ABC transporter permease, partial [Candidatus Gemmiger avicola]|nr:carbohydrate ABC transporter permease [Candidatus Gemmiger avicola]
IPIFQVVKVFGLYNNFLGLIIPSAATPAGVFLVRQYFLTIPNEIMESARIDGASETKIFLRLMLPLAKPIMSVLAIFAFLWRWNDYMWPLVVIRDSNKYTVQLALANFSGQYAVDWGSLLAMSVLTMIPVLILFLLFQKQFMKGMVAGAVKG